MDQCRVVMTEPSETEFRCQHNEGHAGDHKFFIPTDSDLLRKERDALKLQLSEYQDGAAYDQQVRDEFAREMCSDSEGKEWLPGLNLRKLVELIRWEFDKQIKADMREVMKAREEVKESNRLIGELAEHLKYVCMIAERLGPKAHNTHREEALAMLDGTVADAREVLGKTQRPVCEHEWMDGGDDEVTGAVDICKKCGVSFHQTHTEKRKQGLHSVGCQCSECWEAAR